MGLKEHFELMAAYNQWMNGKIYGAARGLEQTELAKDRGAFFGSILGTLNHIVVGDTIWLKRFAMHPTFSIALKEVVDLPSPNKLNDILFEDFAALAERRVWLDNHIIGWVGTLSDEDLNVVLRYQNTKGFRRTVGSPVFFNTFSITRPIIAGRFLRCSHRPGWILA